jgi:hypothetical protein
VHQCVSEMRLRTAIYRRGYISSGIPPSLQFVPLRVRKNIALWRSPPPVSSSPEVQPSRCESAAFFNESINRDIITGRYLKQPSGLQTRGNEPSLRRTHTTLPLIGTTKNVMSQVAVIGVSDDLRSWKELDRFLGTHIGCHWLRSRGE